MACGIDVGSYNLVFARRDEEGNIKLKEEVNAFLEIPLENRFTFNMLKKAKDVRLIERENVAYVVGESAVNLAYSLRLELRRAMRDGCLNPKEKDAYKILSIMIFSLIGEVKQDKEILYYSVPGETINEKTNAKFHQKTLDDIMKKYKINGKIVDAYPINEGLAVVFSELEDKQYTGIGVSMGSGQCNICYSKWTQPVFQFGHVNSGDWIDETVAKLTNENVTVINQEKKKVDLLKAPTTALERAVQLQYRILIEQVVSSIKKKLEENETKVKSEDPIDFALAGGVACINGFEKVFEEVVKDSKLNIIVGEIKKAKDPLKSVAVGALIAAENAS